MKSLPKDSKQEWEIEFDSRYSVICESWKKDGHVMDLEKSLKSFIHQTLNQQKKKWVSELEGEKKINCEENPKSDFIDFQVLGYNQGLQTAIDLLGGKE